MKRKGKEERKKKESYLRALFDVVVLAHVWSTHKHHLQLPVLVPVGEKKKRMGVR